MGGFETISPTIRLVAELDEGEDPDTARKELDAIILPMWAKEVLGEIRLVRRRRGDQIPENDKVPQLMGAFKEMVKG